MRRNLYILAQCTFLLFITLLVNGCSLGHFYLHYVQGCTKNRK